MIQDIIISIAAAAAIGYAAQLLRQPVILGYVLAGVLVGPHLGFGWVVDPEAIDLISELGLIALLFMIGLHIDLRRTAQSGAVILIAGVAQFVLCVALGLAFFGLPIFSGGGEFAVLYLAVTFALSSTMIVVKLLYDKLELDTLAGRITLSILVLQDVWAIVFLAIQPNLSSPEIGPLGLSFLKGGALVGGALLGSRFLLPYVFRSIARNTELVVVIALGWCFLFAWLSGDVAQLSRALGAFIAGVSLSTFPYNPEITDRIASIRSFFLILFFVSLGMKVNEPTLNIFLISLLASVFLIGSRFITVFPVLYLLKKGIRASFLTSLNIAQISEFSLVIVALGVGYGHVDETVMTVILFTLMITAVVSTYMITYSNSIQRGAVRALKTLRLPDIGAQVDETGEPETHRPILFLGFHNIASSLLHALEEQDPSIRDRIAVLDFNPDVHQELTRRGIRCVYGDVSNTSTMMESGLDKAKVVLSTIPDTILKGTTNMALLAYTKRVNPTTRVVVTTESVRMARSLWNAGADFVLLPHMEASDRLAPLIEHLLSETASQPLLEHRNRIMAHQGEVVER